MRIRRKMRRIAALLPTRHRWAAAIFIMHAPISTTSPSAHASSLAILHTTASLFLSKVRVTSIIDNLTLLTNLGSAFQTPNGGGYRGFRVANSLIARTGNRPLSGVGDIFHIGPLEGDVIIEGNDIGYQGDDGANIYSVTLPINKLESVNGPGRQAVIGIPNSCFDPNSRTDRWSGTYWLSSIPI